MLSNIKFNKFNNFNSSLKRLLYIGCLATILGSALFLSLVGCSPFGVVKNLKKLFDFKTRENEILYFDQIRSGLVLALFAIHSLLFRFAYAKEQTNGEDIMDILLNWRVSVGLFTATIGSIADSFFVISAILFTRSVLSNMRE